MKLFNSARTFSLASGIFALITGTSTQAASYDMPFFANDLKGGERFFTSNHANSVSQKFGYDVTAKRLKKNGTWTSLKAGVKNHWDNPKNTSYVVWGKPFYAVSDGIVIGCWRRAPENPRAKLPSEDASKIPFKDQQWLHQAHRDGWLPGGGNELWILNDNGTRTLYAHAQSNSIPASLCPKSKRMFDKPKSSSDARDENGMPFQVALKPSERVRVKKGQFLGRIGHSGRSTGPHHHFHSDKKNANGQWVAEPMKFSRGMSTPWNKGKVDIDKWTSFSGRQMPKGNILFWPPTRLSSEYARHKFPQKDMKRMFKHLANSGFIPSVMDCYNVNKKTYYNMIWHKGNAGWRAYYGQSASALQTSHTKAKSDGYSMTYLESCNTSAGPRYTTVFKKNAGSYRWKTNLSPQAYQSDFNQSVSNGFRPVNVSVISSRGKRRISVLYRKKSLGSWQAKSFLNNTAYQKAVSDNKAAGRIPFYISVYMHEGAARFSAIFASKPAGQWKAKHNLTTENYQTQWKNALNAGMLTRTLAGYDGAKNSHRFAAAWRK